MSSRLRRAAGGVAWCGALACVWSLDVVAQYHQRGLPLSWAVVDALLTLSPGIALTPVVIPAIRAVRSRSKRLWTRLPSYAAVATVYWVLWSFLLLPVRHAGLFRGPDPTTGSGSALLYALAGLSFTAMLLFTSLVVLHEASVFLNEERRRQLRTSKLQLDLARARTSALDAQLNPHFLFNTMHAASSLISSDPAAARQVLQGLKELLGDVLEQDGERLVPLSDELQWLRKYVRLQQIRFGKRLRIRFDVDPDTLALGVPRLMLQPLVENAIVHGVAPLTEGGSITVSAHRRLGRLRIRVTDDGTGADMATAGEHVGLGGVRARINLAFGEDALLSFHEPVEGGLQVELSLPELVIGNAGGQRR